MLTGETWRVGHTQGHNVYQGNVHRLVALGEPAAAAALAGEVVKALNAAAAPSSSKPVRWLVEHLDEHGRWTSADGDTDATVEAAQEFCDLLDAMFRQQRRTTEPQTRVVALYRAPGAVAAAPGTVDDLARLLAASWAAAEPSHGVTAHPASYVASWADVARALVAAGWRPGAVAAAPPGDEDGTRYVVVDDWHREVDGPFGTWQEAHDARTRPEEQVVETVSPAPPAGHEDEAAVERAARPRPVHFVPWGSTAAPCGWQCPRGDRDALPLTDRRRQTTCGACQERMTNWYPGERPSPVWPDTAAARGPRTPGPGAGA